MEECRPVVGYEGIYEVSSVGRVKSLRNDTRIKDKESRIMRQKFDGRGYLRVNLHKDKKCKSWLVSRLVAMAFIPNPYGYKQVGHDDDNKINNNVSNLYWTYPAENQTHNGLHLRTRDKRQRNIQKVIDALAMPVIAKSRDTGEELFFTSMREAERKGFDSGKISMCCAGKRASHKNYTWRKAK